MSRHDSRNPDPELIEYLGEVRGSRGTRGEPMSGFWGNIADRVQARLSGVSVVRSIERPIPAGVDVEHVRATLAAAITRKINEAQQTLIEGEASAEEK